MAQFCMFCGRRLEENESCDCEGSKRQKENANAQAASLAQEEPRPVGEKQGEPEAGQRPVYHQEPSQPKKPSALGVAFKNFFPFFKALLQKPVNAITSIAKHEDVWLAAIYLVVFVLSFGLFFFCGIRKTYHIFGIRTSFPLAWLYGILLAIILEAVAVLALFLIGRLCQSDASFKKVFAVSAVSFVYPAVCVLVGCLSWFLPIWVTMIIAVLALVSWLLVFYLSIRTLFATEENGAFFIGIILALAAIFVISGLIAQKYSGWAAKHSISEKRTESSIEDFFEDYYE